MKKTEVALDIARVLGKAETCIEHFMSPTGTTRQEVRDTLEAIKRAHANLEEFLEDKI